MERTLPLITADEFAVLPGQIINFELKDPWQQRAAALAMQHGNGLYIGVREKDDAPLDPIVAYALAGRMTKDPEHGVRLLIDVQARYRILSMDESNGMVTAEMIHENTFEGRTLQQSMLRMLKSAIEASPAVHMHVSKDIAYLMENPDLSKLTDQAATVLPLEWDSRRTLMQEARPSKRAELLLEMIHQEDEICEMRQQIQETVVQKMNKHQRDAYLYEQIQVMKNMLGEGRENDLEKYTKFAENPGLPEELREKIKREVRHLSDISPASPEYSIYADYLEQLTALPWVVSTEECVELGAVETKLNQDHYGLEKVKDRVLEYLAVKSYMKQQQSPILCLVGPPGVGKTSIAVSIAEAIGRKFVRISLGGIRDEAEIRGHRKTYIGAMPGRIIKGLRTAGSSNPLMLLDEIDKMASDLKGDPMAALLEVLDPELNHAFRDAYMEVPFDLSNVFFIATANDLSTVPRPLLDRMEIIEVESYTPLEKFHIAKNHLIPKQCARYGMSPSKLRMTDAVIHALISDYTRESGVRSLERKIGELVRKSIRRLMERGQQSITVNEKVMQSMLEAPGYIRKSAGSEPQIGLVNGLAWTSVGGEVLQIETVVMDGSGKLKLTGRMGDVMKESADLAWSYMTSISREVGIDPTFFKEKDIHLHIPEGAVPKDGPSAGITMALAMISAAAARPVHQNIAMTGELTVRGNVLAIGGIKEKMLAAGQIGITNLIVPEQNRKDVEKLSKDVTAGFTIHYVKTMKEVLSLALADESQENEVLS